LRNGFKLSVLTRMLFSALVDADRLDTETSSSVAGVNVAWVATVRELPTSHSKPAYRSPTALALARSMRTSSASFL